MSNQYYNFNLVGLALNYSECIAEEYDSAPTELTSSELTEKLMEALAKVGHVEIDGKKLERSMEYYLVESEEDIYSSDGYSMPFPGDEEEDDDDDDFDEDEEE